MTALWVNRKPSAIQVSKHRPTFKRLLARVDLYQFCSVTMIFLGVLFVLFKILSLFVFAFKGIYKWPCALVCRVKNIFLIKL